METTKDTFKLNIGSDETVPGFVNLPFSDITLHRWPYPDSSVVEAQIGSSICQLALPWVMREVLRVCGDGALFKVTAPYYLSSRWAGDPRNFTRITDRTFDSWLGKGFEMVGVDYVFEDNWKDANANREFAKFHMFNVIKEIVVVLKVVKV